MTASKNLGERISSLEATVASSDKYAHERWHKLDNDLSPITLLPAQIARDLGKMEGRIQGKIGSITEDMERKIADAVARAVAPVRDDVCELKTEVSAQQIDIDALKLDLSRWTGARLLLAYIVGVLVAAASALAGLLGLRGGH